MKRIDESLITPIYVKTGDHEPWPEDRVFYLLSGSGLFLCRNHDFFQSCVPAGRAPTELAGQQSFHRIRYPKLPRRLLERVVGFFDCVWAAHGGEAVAALAWNQTKRKVEIVVPNQQTVVSRNGWGDVFPIGVRYQLPTDLPPHLRVFGDIHSHCGMDAYTSQVDADDETDRSGLHIVVGRLNREPPQFHVEAVIDGTRFHVASKLVMGNYVRRDWKFPKSWLKQVSSSGGKNAYGSSKPKNTVASQYDSGEDTGRGIDEQQKAVDEPREGGATSHKEDNGETSDTDKTPESAKTQVSAKTDESAKTSGNGDSLNLQKSGRGGDSGSSATPDHTPLDPCDEPGPSDERDPQHHEQQ